MRARRCAPAALLIVAGPASAHSFGQLYTLPIPLWLYLYGALAALLISFLGFGYFLRQPAETQPSETRSSASCGGSWVLPGGLRQGLRLLAIASLLLCIASGLFGTANAYHNVNMTLFWIVFLLGFAYSVALLGDLYLLLNPVRILLEWGEHWRGKPALGLRPYPPAWGCWPALAVYMAFIAFELFGRCTPLTLAWALALYTAANLVGALCFGKQAWFAHGDFLALFFAFTARLAPLHFDGRCFRWQGWFEGMRGEALSTYSQLLFVLFMLASTAFDGLHETSAWLRLYWVDFYGAVTPWLGSNIVETYGFFKPGFVVFQYLGLLLSPLLYLLIYLGALALARRWLDSPIALRSLALRFACSLIPIALVYHLSHYFTLLIGQGPQIFRLLLDPFGFGWNLFGNQHWSKTPLLLNMGLVWHGQVALILAGHIASVYLAHREALLLFPTRRQALLSQLPMLLVMVAYTSMGLWILAQPISPGASGGG